MEGGWGRGVWEAALGWRSGPGAHPGSLTAEAGEGALGGLPLQPRLAVPGLGHPGRQGLGGPHGSKAGRPGKAASLSPGCGRTRAAGSAAAAAATAAAAAGAGKRPAPGPSCPSLASPSRAPPPQRLSQRQARVRRPRLGPADPAAPRAPVATWGDGLAAAAPGGAGRGARARRGGGGRCVRSVARSAAEARGPQCARRPPAPAAPPPVWGPARGPRGGASLLAAPRSAEGLGPAPGVTLCPWTACWSGPPCRSSSSSPQSCPRLADPGS